MKTCSMHTNKIFFHYHQHNKGPIKFMYVKYIHQKKKHIIHIFIASPQFIIYECPAKLPFLISHFYSPVLDTPSNNCFLLFDTLSFAFELWLILCKCWHAINLFISRFYFLFGFQSGHRGMGSGECT